MSKWKELESVQLNLSNLQEDIVAEMKPEDWSEVKERLVNEIEANKELAGALTMLHIVLDLLILGKRLV